MAKQTITKKTAPKKAAAKAAVLQELDEIIDTLADESVESEFSYSVPDEGEYGARLVEYIELGKQVTYFEGKASKPKPQVRLTFELLDPELAYERDDDGVKSVRYPTQSVTITKGNGSKSSYIKFLKAFKSAVPELSEAKQLVAFIDKPIVLKIVHTPGKKDPSKIYINLKADHISSVTYKDKKTKKLETVEVPEATATFRMLLWDNPSITQWDSLFIDGTREKDGVTKSKNWIQELILKANNFSGSTLSDVLEGAGVMDDFADSISNADDYIDEDGDEDVEDADEEIDEDVLDDGDFLEDDEVGEWELEEEEAEEEIEEEEEVEEVVAKPTGKKSVVKAAPVASTKLKAPTATSAKPVLTKTTSPSKPVARKRAASLAKDIGLK